MEDIMQKWEYCVATIPEEMGVEDQAKLLNKMGTDSWELVSVVLKKEDTTLTSKGKSQSFCYFKRFIPITAKDISDKVKDLAEVSEKELNELIDLAKSKLKK
jgi:hypothetical protein